MKKPRRRITPVLDTLEDRRVLSTYGNAWFDPAHLTVSFAPDGTRDGLARSSLFANLNGLNVNGNDWQKTLLRAFQTWESGLNLNVGLVSDGGQDFGTPGAIQGDSRFGDIRIGAVPQTSGTLALTQPVGYEAGTWTGDMNLNASSGFSLGGGTGVDLFTVALHEIGHDLGLDDSTDPTSVMYDSFTAPRTVPSSADFAAVQAIYGARPTDTPNNSFAAASNLTLVNPLGTNANLPHVTVTNSLATSSSADYYALTASSNPGPTTFQIHASGLSLLQATLTVYDGGHNVIAQASASDPRTNDVSVQVPGLTPGATYYVSVKGANGDAFSIGSYQLRAVPNAVLAVNSLPWSTVASVNGFNNLDLGTNDTPATATSLDGPATKVGPTNFFYQGSLSTASDVDYYSFTTPAAVPTGSQSVMTVAVWGTSLTPVDGNLTVYDAAGRSVAATVLEHTGNTYVIQVSGVTLNSTYEVKVSAYNPGTLSAIGNYGLSVAFGTSVEAQSGLAAGTFTQAAGGGFGPGATSSVSSPHDTLFNFNLATDNGRIAQNVVVQLTIRDASGNAVATLQTPVNKVQSLQTWLAAGTYSVTASAVNQGWGTAAPVKWTIAYEALSDPIKVYSAPSSGATPPQ